MYHTYIIHRKKRRMTPLDIVQQWINAANCQDITALLALSAINIEIVGPRGSSYGHETLADWVRRAGVRFTTRRTFARNNQVVVMQHGVWQSVESGIRIGEADVATSFHVHEQHVQRVARYDALDDALRDASLSLADER